MTRQTKIRIAGLVLIATLAAGITPYLRRQNEGCTAFDPDRVAYLEKAGWEAYYNRDWPRVLMLMVQMNRTQFCMGWLDAVAGAIDIVRAAAAFAPVGNDIAAAAWSSCCCRVREIGQK